MKKLLYLCTIILVVACSNDDSASVTASNDDGITDLYATGTVSEQTPTEAKETIYGKWSFSNNLRLAASDCTFNSIEFTDDLYIMQVTVDGESQTLSGDYEINVSADGNVSSVDLKFEYDNDVITIASLTEVVVTESATEIYATFLIEWSIPEELVTCDSLLGEYSAEKDAPMDESITTDPDSNHAKVVGNWTFVSMIENTNLDRTSEWLNEPCYEYSSDEDDDVLIDGCTTATSITLTISAYGTYALVWRGSNQGTYIESNVWNWTDETQTAFTVGYVEDTTVITIEYLTDTEARFSSYEQPDPVNAPNEEYYTEYTFSRD